MLEIFSTFQQRKKKSKTGNVCIYITPIIQSTITNNNNMQGYFSDFPNHQGGKEFESNEVTCALLAGILKLI